MGVVGRFPKCSGTIREKISTRFSHQAVVLKCPPDETPDNFIYTVHAWCGCRSRRSMTNAETGREGGKNAVIHIKPSVFQN